MCSFRVSPVGLPVLGFINPTLYAAAKSNPEVYNDVTTGYNNCGVGRSLETAPCCDHGFASAAGWDATTGLGSINFGLFADRIVMNDTFFPTLAGERSAAGAIHSRSSVAGAGASSTSSSSFNWLLSIVAVASLALLWVWYRRQRRQALYDPLPSIGVKHASGEYGATYNSNAFENGRL